MIYLDIALSAIIIVLLFLSMFAYVNKTQISSQTGLKNKMLAALPSEKMQKVYFSVFVLISFGIVLMLYLFYKRDLLFVLKRIAVLSLLCPIVWIDKKEKIIPNAIIIIGLVISAVLLIIDGIFAFETLKKTFLPNIIATALVFAFMIIFTLITRGGMGAGDIKLFVVMSLLLGSPSILAVLFFTAVASFFGTSFLLISRKKGKKDNIAFAPMIFAGTLISMFVTGA